MSLELKKRKSGTVLIVDPDAGSRAEVAEILQQFVDGAIIAVEDVDQALAVVEAAVTAPSGSPEKVDVALVDLALWQAGGPRLCHAVRDLEPRSAIPIVVMVSFENEHLIDAALQAGATDLLYRPVRPRELAARVHAAITARREREERSRRERRLAEISRELIDTNRHLERLVCVDSLTGLANRRHLGTILAGEWRRASRTGCPVSAVMIDLDEFHAYNEQEGHPGGDACLRRVAEALAEQLRRPSDLIGRYGGEEFLAILPDTAPEGAAVVAERLRAVVESLQLPHRRSRHRVVTVSVGSATARPDGEADPEALVAAADRALYRAKQSGRNCTSAEGAVPDEARRTRSRNPTGSDRWPSPVWMDPVYADRLPGVIANMRRYVDDLVAAVAAVDSPKVTTLIEELRAIGSEYGFEVVERMITAFDRAHARGDAGNVSHLLEELGWYLERVPVVYRSRTLEMPRFVVSSV
jgi:two-component system chemotaxis family response regulator WspR